MFAPSPFFTIFMSLTFFLASSSKLSHSLASEDTPPFARNSRFLFPLFTLLPLRLNIISPRKPSLIPPSPQLNVSPSWYLSFCTMIVYYHVYIPHWTIRSLKAGTECLSTHSLNHFSRVSLRPCGLQSVRLLCPWDSPGKNTGVGFRFLL